MSAVESDVVAAATTQAPATRRGGVLARPWLVLVPLLISVTATIMAMRHTSPTFDEIVLVAGGARGYRFGSFNLAPEHPPLMQYVYGLPVWLSHPRYPVEPPQLAAHPPFSYRYDYARAFYFMVGNDPERISFLGRLPAALLVGLLVLLTFEYTRRRRGVSTALLAATLVALLPDVLAHGGVAYNDLPLAVAYLGAVWALDSAVRRPGWASGALAGAAVALAVAVKFSGAGVLVAGVALLALEGATRWRDAAWRRGAGVAVLAALAAGYLALVLVYRGDFTLAELWYGLSFTGRHVQLGHGAPAYLAGETRAGGWWYFFPVAFLYKTPAALHVMGVLALAGLAAQRGSMQGRAWLGTPLRAAWVGFLTFVPFLLLGHLEIGFRYALPALPPLCILVAAGVSALWSRAGTPVRALVVALVVWYAASVLSIYPNFLAYTSEYGPGRDRGDELLLDSSLDWGQGLLQLRDWMRQERVDRVYLAYFGSAMPNAYGIDYVPLFSYVPLVRLRPPRPGTPDPRFVVISATLLHPVYSVGTDPFGRFRDVRPYRVIGHDLFVYRLHD